MCTEYGEYTINACYAYARYICIDYYRACYLLFVHMTIEQYVEENYSELRSEFVEFLVSECGYSRHVAEESDDGFDARVLESYNNK